MTLRSGEPLSSQARRGRAIAVSAFLLVAAALRAIDPVQFGGSWLFPTSCGALTGLPCIFCGMTRALHYLLAGNFRTALYFNWLAFPFAVVCVVAVLVMMSEIITGRRLVHFSGTLHVGPRTVAIAFTAIVALWSLQAYLAVAGHKQELLNPHGPLYAIFVR
jgi:hypothetical protein